MEVVTDLKSLKMRIEFLQKNRVYQKETILEETHAIIDSLKPANIFRSFLHTAQGSSELKSDIMHGIIGLGTGMLTNKLLLNSFNGPLKKLLAIVVQAGITNVAVKYPEEIKAKGISFLTRMLQAIKFKSDSDQNHGLE
ncbi:MAG TPA: hypothetical protein VGB43_08330 [Flavobacterium sp.]|jgi:hypothetical protein